jgi:predicted Fe-Mo cluster-binding NifX family protein
MAPLPIAQAQKFWLAGVSVLRQIQFGKLGKLVLKRDKMKIVVSAMEPDLNSEVAPRFGRSRYFVLIESETMQVETFKNLNFEASTDAGISTAQLVCDKGAGMVITGKIGPKAYQVLATAGVSLLTGIRERIGDVIESIKAGKLSSGTDSDIDPFA